MSTADLTTNTYAARARSERLVEVAETTSVMEAAGIEPVRYGRGKRRRRTTFATFLGGGNELRINSLSPPLPWNPLESSPVVEK